MFNLGNRKKILKIATMIVAAFIFLTACNGDGVNMDLSHGEGTPNYQNSQKNAQANCWQKSVLSLLYNVMSEISITTLNKFTQGALAIAMIGFAVWMIIKLLAYVSSITENSGAELWNEIFKKLFLCFVCGTIANSPTMMLWVLNTLIFPIYIALLELGSNIVNLASSNGSEVANTGITVASCGNLPGTKFASGVALPTYPRAMMSCLICSVNQQMSIGLSLSFTLMATKGIGFFGWLSAAILGLTFTILRLGFVFYLVDTLFRMCIVIILLPLFVLSYAFEYTKSYPKVAFSNLISSAAYMLMISIILSISIMAVTNYLTGTLKELNELSNVTKNATMSKYKAANEPIFIILCFAFLVSATLKISKELANKLILPSGAISDVMQKNIKGGIMTLVKVGAFFLAGPLAKKLVSKVADKVKKTDRYQNAKEWYKKSWAGRNVTSPISNVAKGVSKGISKVSSSMNNASGRK